MFTVAFSVIAQPVFAVTEKEIQAKKQEKKEVTQQRASLQQKIAEKERLVNSLQAEQADIEADIKQLDEAVAQTNQNIRDKQAEIETTREEIRILEEKIAEVKQRIELRNELLTKRVRSLQVGGGVVSYLDVLLGAKSMSDFLDRASAVSTLFEADKAILKAHQEDKVLKEQQEVQMETTLQELEQKLVDLEQLEASLKAQIAEKDRIMEQLAEKEEQVHEELYEIEDEEALLRSQEAVLDKLIKRMIEQKKREEEEARKRGQTPKVTDGTFMRPAVGPVTSNYGARWGTTHFGIDIGKRGSDVPIVAAAEGVVFRSYYSSSYGNVVFISHYLNDQVWTTVYAHMENRLVSEGQSVSKGQKLGYMGNTGRSFGAHLHFELHKGPWNASKSNAIDPRKYINF
ncbi:peptidase M23 [Bacillus sp. HMF5848]|nr:peptidase M23 [Bacillus sp. HMF5848]